MNKDELQAMRDYSLAIGDKVCASIRITSLVQSLVKDMDERSEGWREKAVGSKHGEIWRLLIDECDELGA